MTAIDPAGTAGPHIIETQLRVALSDARQRDALLKATGWDASMPSKIMSGGTGITLDKLDVVCRLLGLTLVPITYMDYLAHGNKIGSNCLCARASMGHCGPRS